MNRLRRPGEKAVRAEEQRDDHWDKQKSEICTLVCMSCSEDLMMQTVSYVLRCVYYMTSRSLDSQQSSWWSCLCSLILKPLDL